MIENVNPTEFAELIGSVAKSGPINTAEACKKCTGWHFLHTNGERSGCEHCPPTDPSLVALFKQIKEHSIQYEKDHPEIDWDEVDRNFSGHASPAGAWDELG